MNTGAGDKGGGVTVLLLSVVMLLSSQSVLAHASLDQETAMSGDSFRGVLRISHGCNGSPTVSVRIRIPEEVRRTKPMPKPGWELKTVVTELDQPYESYGSTVTEDVRELSWSGGSLADDFFDEFIFRASLPEVEEETVLYFRTVQECANGEVHRWIETPASGETAEDYREPAPSLRLLPVGVDEE